MLYSPPMTMRALPFCLLILMAISALGQEHRASPLSITTSRYKSTYVKIVYRKPKKNGRVVFGGLVPYGQVWRAGANEATEITLTGDVLLSGQLLRAGTYSIFTIPNERQWTIIINADLGLWGSYNYNPKRDVLRLEVPSMTTQDVAEAFTIGIDARNNKAGIYLHWDKTKVVIPVEYKEPDAIP